MKNKVKPLCCILLIITFSFNYSNQVFGQEKVNISIGIGLPELLNINVRYQLKQSQIRIGFGTLPLKEESLISISGDFYYHFGGFSELSNRRPWYGRIGLNYLRDETESIIDKYLFLNTRIGRDFNISNKIGIEIDIGTGIRLKNEVIRKKPSSGWIIAIEVPFIPSIGIGLFYRI